jgi:hypothetical protein
MKITALTNVQLGLPDPKNAGWGGKAPLWFYVLREAELLQGRRRLGPIGSRPVAEVIIGILTSDKSSYLFDKTPFKPHPAIAHRPVHHGRARGLRTRRLTEQPM